MKPVYVSLNLSRLKYSWTQIKSAEIVNTTQMLVKNVLFWVKPLAQVSKEQGSSLYSSEWDTDYMYVYSVTVQFILHGKNLVLLNKNL